jgi:hypothetical protein
VIVLLIALACSRPIIDSSSNGGDTETDTGVIDALPNPPDPPEGGLQIITPTYRIGPYGEATYCLFGSFEGEGPIAINYAAMYEDVVVGHHIQFNSPRDGMRPEIEDGEVTDCFGNEEEEGSATTQLLSLTHPVPGGGEMVLPENYGVQVSGGDRWILEYHVVNTTGRTVDTAGAINLGFIEPSTVEGWVSAYNFNAIQFNLPAGETTEVVVDCEWGQEAEVLVMAGHMHDWGLSFRVESVDSDGTAQTIYELDPWDLDWRYSPVVENFDGGIIVPEGTTFRTTCTFFNSKEHDMNFPEEMCSTSGLFGPSSDPYPCDVEL